MPSTSASSQFSGAAALELPHRYVGTNIVPWSDTIPTAELGEAGDRRRLAPIGDGLELLMLYVQHGDMDTNGTPTLDADIILKDDKGDTILYNAGAAFQAVGNGVWVFLFDDSSPAPRVKGKSAELQLLVNTPAATPAAVACAGFVIARS